MAEPTTSPAVQGQAKAILVRRLPAILVTLTVTLALALIFVTVALSTAALPVTRAPASTVQFYTLLILHLLLLAASGTVIYQIFSPRGRFSRAIRRLEERETHVENGEIQTIHQAQQLLTAFRLGQDEKSHYTAFRVDLLRNKEPLFARLGNKTLDQFRIHHDMVISHTRLTLTGSSLADIAYCELWAILLDYQKKLKDEAELEVKAIDFKNGSFWLSQRGTEAMALQAEFRDHGGIIQRIIAGDVPLLRMKDADPGRLEGMRRLLSYGIPTYYLEPFARNDPDQDNILDNGFMAVRLPPNYETYKRHMPRDDWHLYVFRYNEAKNPTCADIWRSSPATPYEGLEALIGTTIGNQPTEGRWERTYKRILEQERGDMLQQPAAGLKLRFDTLKDLALQLEGPSSNGKPTTDGK